MSTQNQIQIDHIPPMPTVMLALMRFDPQQPENDADALERVIRPDKGVSSELLKVANSALYGRSGKIKDLHSAITLLGVKPARNLIIMLSTKKFQANLKGDPFQKYLIEYPIVAALITLDLARPTGNGKHQEDAFLGALLHKIGMTIIALNAPDQYKNILKMSASDGFDLLELESELLGTTHINVARDLFEKWHFPEQMQAVVTQHVQADISEADNVVKLVCMGGLLARRQMQLWQTDQDKNHYSTIQKSFNLEEQKLATFSTAEYFEHLQDHPFYEQALS